MSTLKERYPRFCPHSGRFIGFKIPKGFTMVLAPIIGLVALGWIVFRVATKPSRIAYPCVRAAMPLASSLIGYVLFFGASLGLWMKAKNRQTVIGMALTAEMTVPVDLLTQCRRTILSHDVVAR